jgi:hypothetical protein
MLNHKLFSEVEVISFNPSSVDTNHEAGKVQAASRSHYFLLAIQLRVDHFITLCFGRAEEKA